MNTECQHPINEIDFKTDSYLDEEGISYDGVCACGRKVKQYYPLSSSYVFDKETEEMLYRVE